MKTCKKCGKLIEDDALVCPYCGCVNRDKKKSKVEPEVTRSGGGNEPPKKRKTWLWILGWLFIFPLPLTILLLRNQKMNKVVKYIIIVVAWLFYLLIASATRGDSGNETAGATSNIKELKFTDTKDITVKVGKSDSNGYLKVSVKKRNEFSPDDVVFVSENPKVAAINLTRDIGTILYYEITGVDGGETNVYAESKDGSVKSENIHVTVPEPIRIDSIEIDGIDETDLAIKKTLKIKVTISPSDAEDKTITWISSDESVATVDEKGIVTAISPGETDMHAESKDGTVKAKSVHVTVPEPIMIDSIEIEGIDKTDLAIKETLKPEVIISPSNAEDKTITWVSSDESVATVNEKGVVTAVGSGEATITAASSNGVESSFDVYVDGDKTLMNVRARSSREDDVNIGDEWSHDYWIDGEDFYRTYGVSVGETLELSAKMTESDDNPDIGSGSVSHTVTEEDISEGFEESFDVYVTENGGKNSGQSAHFVVRFEFTPVE